MAVTKGNDPQMEPVSFASVLNSEHTSKKLNFRTLVNDERVGNYDFVLPKSAIDDVKNINSLVGYFVGKSLAFPIVQNYVKNTWGKFGFQKLMRNDDGVFLSKFASKTGMEQVLERGPWMIRNSPIILTKWSLNLPLTKGEVTKVPVWVKLHRVPLLAYSEDSLSLIATQIEFKQEVVMAIPEEDGNGIRATNKSGADLAPKVHVVADSSSKNANGPSTSNSFHVLNHVDVRDDCGVFSSMGIQEEKQEAGNATASKHRSSKWNEGFASDDDEDEVYFPEDDKIGDQFDIRLKSRVRK
ncbi:nucleotide-binding alpha-beta plait domain-containing protein [Tanacetum coccineum]